MILCWFWKKLMSKVLYLVKLFLLLSGMFNSVKRGAIAKACNESAKNISLKQLYQKSPNVNILPDSQLRKIKFNNNQESKQETRLLGMALSSYQLKHHSNFWNNLGDIVVSRKIATVEQISKKSFLTKSFLLRSEYSSLLGSGAQHNWLVSALHIHHISTYHIHISYPHIISTYHIHKSTYHVPNTIDS